MDYRPERYQSTFEKSGGLDIWTLLTTPDNIIRMETATYLSRPAVEPLSPILLGAFGDSVRVDRIKQMIGHMARQIMEHQGYCLQQNNVKITSKNNMFSRASRYVKIEDLM